MLREPAVAGAFYPGQRQQLEAMLDEFVASDEAPKPALGGVSPHAGYIYSGRVAGALFARMEVPETAVILGPNHRGVGARYGVFAEGAWRTPLGEAAVDEKFAAALLETAAFLHSDASSHVYEHSIEVQVPFLQYRRRDVRIVPISIAEHDYDKLVKLGHAIAATAQSTGTDVLVLASSDMTHYEDADSAARKDRMAIERMEALDEEGLWRVVNRHRISMCGVAPAVATLVAVRQMGAREGRLVKYATSGDETGDYNEVVGYASLVFTRGSE